MGLCDVLGNVMATLAEENYLLSWTVYYETNGQISLKVRYQSSQKSANRDQEDVHYRKKSTRQQQRDRERSRAWHKQKQAVNVDQHCEQTEESKPPGVSSSMPVGLQTRSKTKAASLCTPEILRTSSTPDTYCLSDMNPDAVPFSPLYSTICDKSVLCVQDIHVADSPDRRTEEDTHPSLSVTLDDSIDDISSIGEDISEPNCSDSNDKNTTKQDVNVKAKSKFCMMCWFYDQGTGRCQEHG